METETTNMGSNPLKTIRETFVNSIGPKATHALEAGFVLFFIVSSIPYYPNLTALFASLYGVEKTVKKIRNGQVKTKNLYLILKEIVPKTHLQHIRIQPIYFIFGSILGSVLPYVAAIIQCKALLPI